MAGLSPKPIIWIIDTEQWPRSYLRAELMERGFEVIGFDRICRALEAFQEELYEKPYLVIIELRNLSAEPNEIRSLAYWHVRKILLAGMIEANEAWVGEQALVKVMKRPLSIGEVADAAEKEMGYPLPSARRRSLSRRCPSGA